MKSVNAGVVAIFILSFALPSSGAPGNQSAAPKAWNPPRTADGQPDMQGSWGRTAATGAAAYDVELGSPTDENVLNGSKPRPKPHVIQNPPIPYQQWALALRDENRKNSFNPTKLEQIDSLSRCLQMGAARQGLSGFQIIQPPGFVVIGYGQDGSWRRIPLDGRPHIDAAIKLWDGDSVGHWEGTTLVVDVTNINEHGYYDWAGNFHSNELHIVERWTFVDANTITYEMTSDDPKVFTRPWAIKYEYARNKDADAEVYENDCFENEHDVSAILQPEKPTDPGSRK